MIPGFFLASALWNWIHRLGGPGLILLGLADNSLVPLPGSVDALTIILSAHRKEWWLYYAVTATIGAVVGGYLTFRLGEKGGEEALAKENIPEKRAQKVYGIFNKYGFWAITIPALLPPPVPIVPFLLAAGRGGSDPRPRSPVYGCCFDRPRLRRLGAWSIQQILSSAARYSNHPRCRRGPRCTLPACLRR